MYAGTRVQSLSGPATSAELRLDCVAMCMHEVHCACVVACGATFRIAIVLVTHKPNDPRTHCKALAYTAPRTGGYRDKRAGAPAGVHGNRHLNWLTPADISQPQPHAQVQMPPPGSPNSQPARHVVSPPPSTTHTPATQRSQSARRKYHSPIATRIRRKDTYTQAARKDTYTQVAPACMSDLSFYPVLD